MARKPTTFQDLLDRARRDDGTAGWTRTDAASKANVSTDTIRRALVDGAVPRRGYLVLLATALAAAGVEVGADDVAAAIQAGTKRARRAKAS